MLQKVLSYLPFSSLASACLVCRLWRDLGEQPRFWQELNLYLTKKELPYMEDILACRRLAKLSKIRMHPCPTVLADPQYGHSLFKILLELELESLTLEGTYLMLADEKATGSVRKGIHVTRGA